MARNKVAESGSLDFARILAEYSAKYNVDTLDSPNDRSNLHAMIRNAILIEKLQARLAELANDPEDINPIEIKKVLDSIVALSETNIQYERTLGIDRKTRKQENSESVADYITGLKQRAKEWLDDENRLTKVMCPNCKILVGRISGVYATTAYKAEFQCPQCQKAIRAFRKERDTFFDVKDGDWRSKFPIEIEHPKRSRRAAVNLDNIEDDVILSADTEVEE
jgi:hypothetical protein